MIRILLLSICLPLASSIPIENGVKGDPEIECASNGIVASFNLENIFEGHVFVKGRYDEPGCRNDESGRNTAGITLPFNDCGVSRTRSLNPKGIFVETTIIITFHPQFITKVDRAYTIQCFYMEADKTVSTDLEVSMITTRFRTQVVLMPTCRYEILEGGPTGIPVQYALIGDQVYHKWTCESNTVDTFCMVVHSCFVDDGNGDRVDLLDESGCAQDKFLLNNLEYPTDLMAGQEAHVFKYADRPALFFQCQITITIKEPNGQCVLPECPEPPRRSKRSPPELANLGNTWDVKSQLIQTIDIDERNTLGDREILRVRLHDSAQEMCLSTMVFTLFVFVFISLLLTAAISTAYLMRRRKQ